MFIGMYGMVCTGMYWYVTEYIHTHSILRTLFSFDGPFVQVCSVSKSKLFWKMIWHCLLHV